MLEQLVKQVADRQLAIEQKLDSISLVLQELAEQKKDIEHLLLGQRDQRDWLKNHESRMQKVELAQKSCNVEKLTKQVDALRQKPGSVALQFLYAMVLLLIGGCISWLAKG